MPSLFAILLIAVSAIAIVKATNTAGDPTDLTNWPPCSQKCVPIGLQAPTSCNSLSNRTCICRDPAFTLAIGDCEVTSCSAEEAMQIQDLTTPLCAPVGGLAANVVSAVNSYLAMSSPVAVASSSLASYPATITADSAASAILATATPEGGSGVGNGANILDYPECVQFCGNQSVAVAGCNVEELDCACGANYLSITAACEQVACSASDRAASQVLANQLCGPVFQNSPSLGSAATSAVASATAVAASVASRDPTKSTSYPLCAQKCQNASIPTTGCGSLANRACLCSNATSSAMVGGCEIATCSASDLQITTDLANSLCAPVGGFGGPYNAPNTTNTTRATSSPIAFAGNAIAVMEPSLGWIVIGFLWVGWLACPAMTPA